MRHLATLAFVIVALGACTPSPWDFPVPTMIGDKAGIAMTGFIKADDEAEVRRRLTQRMRCPEDVEFVSLMTTRADNAIGTKILHYKAVMRCVARKPPETEFAAP